VDWKLRLHRWFDALIPARGPSWNEAVAFAREIKSDLHVTSDPAEIERQDIAIARPTRSTIATHQASEDLRAWLGDVDCRLHALVLLNTITELGEPVGEDLAERHTRLQERLRPCPVTEVAASVSRRGQE